MKPWKTLWLAALSLSLSAVAPAQAQAPEPLKVIRIGVATGGVGSNPVRHGGTSTALAYTDGVLEEEFKKDGVKVEWTFFKGAGPAVNEALVNQQLDFAWQGDLPSIVHRAGDVKTKIILGSGVRTGLYLAVQPDSGIQRTVTAPAGSKRVKTKASTNSSRGTPYCRPMEMAMAKLFIRLRKAAPSLCIPTGGGSKPMMAAKRRPPPLTRPCSCAPTASRWPSAKRS